MIVLRVMQPLSLLENWLFISVTWLPSAGVERHAAVSRYRGE